MTRTLLRLLFGGWLLTVPLYPAYGGESIVRQVTPREAATLPLPPVPQADKIPWLTSALVFNNRPNVDGDRKPKLDRLGPFLIDPVVPLRQFSAIARQPDSAVRMNGVAGSSARSNERAPNPAAVTMSLADVQNYEVLQ